MTKTILVSGSSRGIGRSIAERLLSDGYQLSLGVRNPEALNGTCFDCDQVPCHPYDAVHRLGSTRQLRHGGGSMDSFIALAFFALHHFYFAMGKKTILMICGM